MFVVRPRGIRGTPRKIAQELGCETRFYPNEKHKRLYDYRRDFMMVPITPYPNQLQNYPPEYIHTYNFAMRNKYGQRSLLLEGGIPAPQAANTHSKAAILSDAEDAKFVVRPLRHSRGLGYRVTGNRFDFGEGSEYISELYPKRREYRVIYVFGKPVVVLRKKPNDDVGAEAPWGHENSRFQTINDVAGSRLATTDAIARIGAFAPVMGAHIVAADILFNDQRPDRYKVLELNFCPGLDIDNNRAKVVQEVKARAVS